mmetsp:Transcript_22606/g.57810  ORF Transcript_22606/g.57810 Transcript_22606/m.57810 type:complete len:109 (-) Transcript_22606:90-416(-)|eukprot:CAMPEP_0183509356 /NCGR_PEP_ID=MMETSP0371-20130417/9553_1 /TAXON_ID=268820 /ORGANISM="Peridinium aciculiferum, Strain PAER-2" /LENGTH=108 /DNA_ID=CAMNT_0025705957 /DNA_START=83 /DNA_END=409 /DNA_ORIENTATION=+
MARSASVAFPAVLALAALVLFTQTVFVPAPPTATASAVGVLRGAVASSAMLAASAGAALPAFAEEIDSAEAYNRKVMTGVSVCLSLALVLMGIIIFYTRRVVENKWLN